MARARGLSVTEAYLSPSHSKVDYISAIDVFSHIPDFRGFLSDVRQVLNQHGELFLETGNLADVQDRKDFPSELGLPDHLVFAGERHLSGFLKQAGFDVRCIRRRRIDGFTTLLKNGAKKLLGRPAQLTVPYLSKYRQIQIRARLR
jgi:cyclopropane fatty-acyl-phospholipid synthase-like methyltransferase